MAERELAIIIRARDLASKTLKGVSKELGTIQKRAGKGLGNVASNIGKLGVAAAGISLAGIAGSIKVAADFESSLNTINTVARKTPPELKAIGDGIRGIAKSTGAPLDELTQGFYDLVSAGVDASQAMTVLKSANTLAIGGLATSAETVDLLTTALNTYGVAAKNQGKESQRFSDIFAKSIERGKVTAAELAASFAQVGPIAASNKIEIEELAAGYAQLTAKGVPASEAATQMAAAMIALQRRTGPLEKLEKQTGKSYLAIAGKKGLVFAFEQLRKDAVKSGVPLIDLVGRVEGLQFALNTTGPEFASYNENLAAMGDASGTAAAQMAERQKGLNAQLAKLKALAIDAGITIGSKLLPKLTPLAERAVAFLNTHQADIEVFGDKIAGGFDKALGFAQKIPWGAIGTGLQTAATWAGKLMDVFLALPPEAQATIVALAGLNKLSGGAIGGIVGELGKGLIKGVLGMNAGVVNLNAGVVNGGVGGAGAAGAAGIVGKGASLLQKVFIVGMAAEVASLLSGPIVEAGKGLHDQIFGSQGDPLSDFGKAWSDWRAGADWPFGQKNAPEWAGGKAPIDQKMIAPAVDPTQANRIIAATERAESSMTAKQLATAAATRDVRAAVEANRIATVAAEGRTATNTASVRDRVEAARIAVASAASRVATAASTAGAVARSGGYAAAAAVRAKDLSVRVVVPVTTNVSVRSVIGGHNVYGQYSHVGALQRRIE